jgi:hypothetical protein
MVLYPNREYVILPANEVSNIDFSKVIETSAQTLRYSNDDEYTIVKFEDETPSFLEGKTQYTYTEILEIVNDSNGIWYVNDDTE